MKAQEEILKNFNMLHKQVNKVSNTKKAISAIQMITSIFHSKSDDHGNDMQLRSMSRHHHSPRQSTKRTHAFLGLWSNPSLSIFRRQRRSLEPDIL
jgi:hypothetical protein